MIASRHVSAVCVLLGLALVPTIIHSYVEARVVDGRTAGAVPVSLAGYSSRPSDRTAGWGKRRFDSDDWMERTYTRDGLQVKLTVARTYDPKRVYHHPELAVAYGTTFARHEVVRLPARPELPLHVLYTERGDAPAAAYALHYGDGFVDSPILFQLRAAGELLFSGRKAMTLLFATHTSARPVADIGTAPAVELLIAAVDGFLSGAVK